MDGCERPRETGIEGAWGLDDFLCPGCNPLCVLLPLGSMRRDCVHVINFPFIPRFTQVDFVFQRTEEL